MIEDKNLRKRHISDIVLHSIQKCLIRSAMDFWVVICGVVILMQFLIRWMEMEVVGLVSAHHGEQIVNWNVK